VHVPPKIGPLPTWAWGLVLLGGLGLGLYLRRHSSSSPTASLVSAGSPVDSLAAGGGGSDGSGTSGVSTGMDPALAQMLSDSQSALVNESSIFSGLAAGSVQAALDAAQGALALGATVATTPPVIYTIGSSPAGSSPAGTTTPTPAGGPVPMAPTSTPPAGGSGSAPKAPVTVVGLESKTAQNALPGPTAVKSVTNKTGVSANKGQGVISIH